MKALNARKASNYKAEAALHGLHIENKEENQASDLTDGQEKLLEERIAKLKQRAK